MRITLTAWEKVERGGGKSSIAVEDSYSLNERNRNYLVIDTLAEGDGVGVSFHDGASEQCTCGRLGLLCPDALQRGLCELEGRITLRP
ncbi:hypothetical protein [Paenibacillus borealis]|uniref:hypothetical protein n=1 Tax=Paenibacillus borealis TaxID=160799 RepID=UPI0026AF359C